MWLTLSWALVGGFEVQWLCWFPLTSLPLLTLPFPRSIHEHSSICWHHWGSCCCHCGDRDHCLLLLLPGKQGHWLWDDVSTSPYSTEWKRWRVLLLPPASTDGVEHWGEKKSGKACTAFSFQCPPQWLPSLLMGDAQESQTLWCLWAEPNYSNLGCELAHMLWKINK